MPKDREWRYYEYEECMNCGDDLQVYAFKDLEKGLVCDGDDIRCVSCNMTGSVSADENDANVLFDDDLDLERDIDIFSYRNKTEVSEFIDLHQHLTSLLAESVTLLKKHFNKEITVVFELMKYSGSHTELVGWIQTYDTVDNGLTKLESFEQEWFLNNKNAQEASALFNYNIEMVR